MEVFEKVVSTELGLVNVVFKNEVSVFVVKLSQVWQVELSTCEISIE